MILPWSHQRLESINPLLGSPGCFTATPPAFKADTLAFPQVTPESYNP